jgi:hypothetical protein
MSVLFCLGLLREGGREVRLVVDRVVGIILLLVVVVDMEDGIRLPVGDIEVGIVAEVDTVVIEVDMVVIEEGMVVIEVEGVIRIVRDREVRIGGMGVEVEVETEGGGGEVRVIAAIRVEVLHLLGEGVEQGVGAEVHHQGRARIEV